MRLSVTTPQGALVDAEVQEIIAPGALGEFGVLPGHVPFLSVLRPGVLVYWPKDQDKGHASARTLAVGDGVLQVARSGQDDKILVLVEWATPAKEIDAEAAAREVATLDGEIAKWNKDATAAGEYQALLTRRAWAAARVEAARRGGPAQN
jgi:F-type H+-transporting ATPase subunit epsilon